MPELFDMIAGSETGGIIASSLVLPCPTGDKTCESNPEVNGKKVRYFATTALDWFSENVDELYVDRQMWWWL